MATAKHAMADTPAALVRKEAGALYEIIEPHIRSVLEIAGTLPQQGEDPMPAETSRKLVHLRSSMTSIYELVDNRIKQTSTQREGMRGSKLDLFKAMQRTYEHTIRAARASFNSLSDSLSRKRNIHRQDVIDLKNYFLFIQRFVAAMAFVQGNPVYLKRHGSGYGDKRYALCVDGFNTVSKPPYVIRSFEEGIKSTSPGRRKARPMVTEGNSRSFEPSIVRFMLTNGNERFDVETHLSWYVSEKIKVQRVSESMVRLHIIGTTGFSPYVEFTTNDDHLIFAYIHYDAKGQPLRSDEYRTKIDLTARSNGIGKGFRNVHMLKRLEYYAAGRRLFDAANSIPKEGLGRREAVNALLEGLLGRYPVLSRPVTSEEVSLGPAKAVFSRRVINNIAPVCIDGDRRRNPRFFRIRDMLTPSNIIVCEVVGEDILILGAQTEIIHGSFKRRSTPKFSLATSDLNSAKTFYANLARWPAHSLQIDYSQDKAVVKHRSLAKGVTINISPSADAAKRRCWVKAVSKGAGEKTDKPITACLVDERVIEASMPKVMPTLSEVNSSKGDLLAFPLEGYKNPRLIGWLVGEKVEYYRRLDLEVKQDSARPYVVYKQIPASGCIAIMHISKDRKEITVEGLEIDNLPVIIEADTMHLSTLLFILNILGTERSMLPVTAEKSINVSSAINRRIHVADNLTELIPTSSRIADQNGAKIPTKLEYQEGRGWILRFARSLHWSSPKAKDLIKKRDKASIELNGIMIDFMTALESVDPADVAASTSKSPSSGSRKRVLVTTDSKLIDENFRVGSSVKKAVVIVTFPYNEIPYAERYRNRIPLGAGYICASLREELGAENVEFLDLAIAEDGFDLKEYLLERNFDLVCFSIHSDAVLNTTYRLANEAKEALPKALVAVGGIPPSRNPKKTIEDSGGVLDISVKGEGEEIICNVVRAANKSRSLSEVNGIAAINSSGQYLLTDTASQPDIDSLPHPPWDFIDLSKYELHVTYMDGDCVNIISSRGCPFGCAYCSYKFVSGRAIRLRSAESVFQEMEEHYLQNGIRNFYFVDDFFTINAERVERICEMIIEKGYPFAWRVQTRADSISKPGLLELMKKAGVNHISIGVESGDPAVLRAVHKDLDLDVAVGAVGLAQSLGIKIRVFFMVGLPYQDWESIEKSADFIRRSRPDEISVKIYAPFGGSPISSRLSAWGLSLLPGADRSLEQLMIHDNFHRPESPESHERQIRPVISTRWLTADEIYKAKWYLYEVQERVERERSKRKESLNAFLPDPARERLKIAVVGASSFLGEKLYSYLRDFYPRTIGTGYAKPGWYRLDVRDEDAVRAFIENEKPDLIVYAAGFTDVDKAQRDPELAYSLNASPLSTIARNFNGHMIYISTEGVFANEGLYGSAHDVDPPNMYGKSKVAGERAVAENYDNWHVVRISSLYGYNGQHDKATVVKAAVEAFNLNQPIALDNERIRYPICTDDVASLLLKVVHGDHGNNRILHLNGETALTKYQLALASARAYAEAFYIEREQEAAFRDLSTLIQVKKGDRVSSDSAPRPGDVQLINSEVPTSVSSRLSEVVPQISIRSKSSSSGLGDLSDIPIHWSGQTSWTGWERRTPENILNAISDLLLSPESDLLEESAPKTSSPGKVSADGKLFLRKVLKDSGAVIVADGVPVGSGAVCREDEAYFYIFTAGHLVRNRGEIQVLLCADAENLIPADILGAEYAGVSREDIVSPDWALLRIEKSLVNNPENVNVLPLASEMRPSSYDVYGLDFGVRDMRNEGVGYQLLSEPKLLEWDVCYEQPDPLDLLSLVSWSSVNVIDDYVSGGGTSGAAIVNGRGELVGINLGARIDVGTHHEDLFGYAQTATVINQFFIAEVEENPGAVKKAGPLRSSPETMIAISTAA